MAEVQRTVAATTKASTMLRRGCGRRCPVCGGGHLFRRWFEMAPACPWCGFVFKRKPGQWLGSWFLNVMLVQTVVCLLLFAAVAATWPETPSLLLLALAVAAAVVVPMAFFPFSRTIWSAIDLVMKPIEFDDGVPPGVFLEGDRAELEDGEGDDGEGDGRTDRRARPPRSTDRPIS
jgi:uncharacterized protein (DUF983 family)